MITRFETIVACILTAVVAATLGAGLEYHVGPRMTAAAPTPPPASSSTDPIAATGHTYGTNLLKVYAAAWQDGARKLDGGATVEAGLATVAKSWTTGRGDLYDGALTPVFKTIVPEGTADGDVTPAQLKIMAAAFRSIAAGLSE